MKAIGIIGSRRRDALIDYDACKRAFLGVYEKGDRIVSGGCPRGGDRFADLLARKYGVTITTHYPDWDGVGKGAGFARNSLIASECDILLAVVAKDRTGGTEDTIKKAEVLGKKVVLVE